MFTFLKFEFLSLLNNCYDDNFVKKYQDGFRENKFFNLYNTNKRDETFARFKMNLSLSKNLLLKNTILLSNMDNGYDAWAPDNNKQFFTEPNDKINRSLNRGTISPYAPVRKRV